MNMFLQYIYKTERMSVGPEINTFLYMNIKALQNFTKLEIAFRNLSLQVLVVTKTRVKCQTS